MHRPELVTPPAATPVSVAEVKAQTRVDHDAEDDLLTLLIEAATAHLDGYAGVLGRCLVTQTWKQEYDAFARCLRLPLPAASVTSIIYLDSAGAASAPVSSGDYALQHDALGSFVRFNDDFAFPGDLYETKPVAVTFVAGYGDAADVPANIKAWILANVAHRYFDREAADWVCDGLLPNRMVGV